MFTGIIEEMGTVKALRREAGAARLVLSASKVLEGTVLGGQHLRERRLPHRRRSGDERVLPPIVAVETLKVTKPRRTQDRQPVNLERARQLSARIGGHLVSGHVTTWAASGSGAKKATAGASSSMHPGRSSAYVIKKGSIAVDGSA